MSFLFTSESVCQGHPDKVADQISDAILDACLEQDVNSRVACETFAARDTIHIAGEISTKANIDFEKVARQVITDIGYTDANRIFSDKNTQILITLSEQSPEISNCVTNATDNRETLGAGDQGLMFGFACDHTKEYLPMPIALAHRLVQGLEERQGKDHLIGPDGKVQVTVRFEDNQPQYVDTVLISSQHASELSKDDLDEILKAIVHEKIPKELLNTHTKFYFNPSGAFTVGGPEADCGLTGRKIIVDTYGGYSRHGGGAFSGKDPSKVDRSAAYAARHVAKNIVAAGLANSCEVQLAYGIGMAHPISISVDTKGSGLLSDEDISAMILRVFDLTPKGMIDSLNLKRPIYQQTSHGGHFGRNLPGMTWEELNKVSDIQAFVRANHKNLDLKNKSIRSTTL